MSSDGIENLLIESVAEVGVVFSTDRNQRLEGFQCLDRSFEADRSWFDIVLAGGLGDDRADEIVGEDVSPDLFPDYLRCFAS